MDSNQSAQNNQDPKKNLGSNPPSPINPPPLSPQISGLQKPPPADPISSQPLSQDDGQDFGVGKNKIGVEEPKTETKAEEPKEEPKISVQMEQKEERPHSPEKPQASAPAASTIPQPHPSSEAAKIDIQTGPEIPAPPAAKEDVTPQATPPAPSPTTAAEPEDKIAPKIEVPMYEGPAIKTYDTARAPTQIPAPSGQPPPSVPQPPVKAQNTTVRFGIYVLLALALGTAGGFFGNQVVDRFKTQASSKQSPAATETPSQDVNLWPTMSLDQYGLTIKYPNGWFLSTTDPKADKIVFAANQESLEATATSYKVEINAQDANGKTLKDWVEAASVTAKEEKPIKEITVDEETAYQQELTQAGPAVATYVEQDEKIVVVTYSAPREVFGQGGDWYNKMINSIKLE